MLCTVTVSTIVRSFLSNAARTLSARSLAAAYVVPTLKISSCASSIGAPSFVSAQLDAPGDDDDEIAERMSGNLCRCSAYPLIRAAIAAAREAKT